MVRMASRSSAMVRRIPVIRHWRTASSQAARLKMNVMAGSIPSRSRRSITSARRGVCRADPDRRWGPRYETEWVTWASSLAASGLGLPSTKVGSSRKSSESRSLTM